MAIKVVQGLIDVSRTDLTRSKAAAPSPTASNPPNTTTATPTAQQQTVRIQQETSVLSQSVARLVASSDATVSTVRSRPSNNESSKIRDPEEAHEVAESVAERVVDDEDEALEAHRSLSSSSTRGHITH